MALSINYQARLKALHLAIEDLEKALAENLSGFTERQQDLFRNGQVQKFEFCIELLWKVMKSYLYEKEGIDEVTPKSVIKAFYRTVGIAAEEFEQLIEMIEDRNLLSHVYSKAEFLEIHSHLFRYIQTMRNILNVYLYLS